MKITHTAQISESNDIAVGDLVKAAGSWAAQKNCPLYRVETVSSALHHDAQGWGFRTLGLSEFAESSSAIPSSRDLPRIDQPASAANLPLVKNLQPT